MTLAGEVAWTMYGRSGDEPFNDFPGFLTHEARLNATSTAAQRLRIRSSGSLKTWSGRGSWICWRGPVATQRVRACSRASLAHDAALLARDAREHGLAARCKAQCARSSAKVLLLSGTAARPELFWKPHLGSVADHSH